MASSRTSSGAIRNIRIVGNVDEASATSLRLRKDQRFTDANIRQVSNKSTFNLTVKCRNDEDAEKLEKSLQENYGPSLEITRPTEYTPMLKITNLITDLTDTKLIEEQIRTANFWAAEANFGVSQSYVVHATTGTYTNAIVQCDLATQKLFLERKRIVFGLSSCRVHEHVNLISCRNCQRYAHFERNCSYPTRCKKCGENHKYEDCDSAENIIKCANCTTANRNGSTFNTRHRSSDERCPVRKERIEALKGLHLSKNP